MKVRATTSFSGSVTMYAGEVREIADDFIRNDLIRAGYVEAEEAEAEAGAEAEKKQKKKKGAKSA